MRKAKTEYEVETLLLNDSNELGPYWEAKIVKKYPSFRVTETFMTALIKSRHNLLS